MCNVRGTYAPKRNKSLLALKKDLKLEIILLQEKKIIEGKAPSIKKGSLKGDKVHIYSC